MSIESKERGPEVALQCAWLITGIAIAYWIDFGFTRLNSQVSWVWPYAFESTIVLMENSASTDRIPGNIRTGVNGSYVHYA